MKKTSSQIVKARNLILKALADNSSYQFRYSITRNGAGTKKENNLNIKIAALQLQNEKQVRILDKRIFTSAGVSGVAYTLTMEPSKKAKLKKLIDVNEVASLICRNSSAVYVYIDKGLLPKSCEQKGNKKYWCEKEVVRRLVKVKKYQSKTKGELKAHPKKKKEGIAIGFKPKQTAPQQAANSAFNLCLNN